MPATEALLLDTHAWVWFAIGDVRLKPKTIEAVQAAGRQGKLYLAAISLWEVAMLAAKGRIELGTQTENWLLEASLRTSVTVVPLDAAIAASSCAIELPQGDPADRMIVATALKLGASVLTADEQIQAYAKRLQLNIIKP